MMTVSVEQWSALSERVGGDLLQNPDKLEKMRQVDRSCGADVSWDTFCNKVEFAVNGGIILDDIGWMKPASKKGAALEALDAARTRASKKGADR